MEEKTIITANVDDFRVGYWSEEDQEWYEMTPEEAAKKLACSADLLASMEMNFNELATLIKADLLDLYKMLDKED